ncbi:hypothetical protein [Rhodococcus qingshengii]|uniref:hypothetical protein n=1 Tax=Rhodococcus qingshengii TaxID=334542 RepID=UPI00301AC1C6
MRTELVIATYADVDVQSEEAFRAWQVDVQLPALHASPGVISASWLESVDGQPRFLLLCELAHEALAQSAPVQEALNWGPWTRALRGWHRRSYRPIFALGSSDAQVPYVLTVRTDVDPQAEDAFNDWYNQTHLPEVLQCPGFVTAARYECVEGEPRLVVPLRVV